MGDKQALPSTDRDSSRSCFSPRQDLIEIDRFIVKFVNQAETVRLLWTAERILAELLTLDLTNDQMKKFTYELW